MLSMASSKKGYQMCSRCVMDTTAEEIQFDDDGVCCFCHYFDLAVKPVLERAYDDATRATLHQIVSKIQQTGSNKAYDCILGLSGGIDSSYLASLAVESGLRPLAVHVDTGWNSKDSQHNIECIVDRLGLHLQRVVIDWNEMKDLQLSFYKAAVKDCDIPQDHVFLAVLYKIASQNDIRYILSGGNLASESILPQSWGYNAGDSRHLKAIQKRFGDEKLRQCPTLSFFMRYFYYPFIRKITEVRLLNYVPYNIKQAKEYLERNYDFKYYGAKHFESVLTRFYQGHYLPQKFGIDKRKAHFSSLILAEQMTREDALKELRDYPYERKQMLEDKAWIAKKFGITLDQWEQILVLPPRSHEDFPSSDRLFKVKDVLVHLLKLRVGFRG